MCGGKRLAFMGERGILRVASRKLVSIATALELLMLMTSLFSFADNDEGSPTGHDPGEEPAHCHADENTRAGGRQYPLSIRNDVPEMQRSQSLVRGECL